MNSFSSDGKVEEIRRAADIVDVISEYVALTKSGRNFKGLCPFHSEKTPSFMVSPDKQIYHCFGCGTGGNVFNFIMKHENIAFPAVLSKLAGRYGIKLEYKGSRKDADEIDTICRINETASDFFASSLNKASAKKTKGYLDSRGIDEKIVQKFNIGYAPESWDALSNYLAANKFSRQEILKSGLVVEKQGGTGYYDRFRDRIIFPIHDRDGKIVAFGGRVLGNKDEAKYINSPETPVYKKSRILYGLFFAKDSIRKEKAVLITEGYMDAISAVKHGFNNVVATLGTALTEEHLRVLKAYTDNLILVFDADTAGMNAVLRAWETIINNGLSSRVLVLPSGEDLDSSLNKYGREYIQSLIEKAVDTGEFIISEIIKPFDIKDSGDRKKALTSIFGALKAVSNVFNLAVYGSFIAERLRTDEEIIIEAFKNMRRSKNDRRIERGNEEFGKKAHLNNLEVHMLMISLASKEWASRVFAAIKPDDIEDLALRKIAEKLNNYPEFNGEIDVGKICEELDDNSACILSEIVFRKEEMIDLNKSFDDCLKMFRRRKYARALESNKEDIKKAVTRGDEGLLENLLKENQRLQVYIKAKL